MMRVVHLPTSVGGNPQGISKHLNELGLQSQTWVIAQNYFNYPADKVICEETDSLCVCELKRLFALRYILSADIVFFNYGTGLFRPALGIKSAYDSWYKLLAFRLYSLYSSFMSVIEVSILQILCKPIFIQYQGDDARQGRFCRENFAVTFANQVDSSYYNESSDNAKKKSIAFYGRRATRIYALNPDLLHVLPSSAEFLPYSHVSVKDVSPVFNQHEERPLRIGHAPSHRVVKGTDLLLDALQELALLDYSFELILIEGVPNAEAIESYKTVDILFDQLFAGWYGGVAVEAMALGKPVMSYIRETDLVFIPEEMRIDLPIINVRPETLVNDLERILTLPRGELVHVAHRSRAYVEKWHNPRRIAERLKRDMEIALLT